MSLNLKNMPNKNEISVLTIGVLIFNLFNFSPNQTLNGN